MKRLLVLLVLASCADIPEEDGCESVCSPYGQCGGNGLCHWEGDHWEPKSTAIRYGSPSACCSPRTHEDCRQSEDCRNHGHCGMGESQWGLPYCMALTDDDCSVYSNVCQEYGWCTSCVGTCIAGEC